MEILLGMLSVPDMQARVFVTAHGLNMIPQNIDNTLRSQLGRQAKREAAALPRGWQNCRNATIGALADNGYSDEAIANLTLSELQAANLPEGSARETRDRWLNLYGLMPNGPGVHAGYAFVSRNGTRLHKSDVQRRIVSHRASLAKEAASALPAGWQEKRNALIIALDASRNYTPRQLADLTVADLEAAHMPEAAVDLTRNQWLQVYNRMPDGPGKLAGRAFISRRGLALSAREIQLITVPNRRIGPGHGTTQPPPRSSPST